MDDCSKLYEKIPQLIRNLEVFLSSLLSISRSDFWNGKVMNWIGSGFLDQGCKPWDHISSCWNGGDVTATLCKEGRKEGRNRPFLSCHEHPSWRSWRSSGENKNIPSSLTLHAASRRGSPPSKRLQSNANYSQVKEPPLHA